MDTEPRRLCATHPVREGKTKPLGAALALKAAGTALHRCPEACRLQSDDRTDLTSTQINLAYPPCLPVRPIAKATPARNRGIIGAEVRPNRRERNHGPKPRDATRRSPTARPRALSCNSSGAAGFMPSTISASLGAWDQARPCRAMASIVRHSVLATAVHSFGRKS